MAVAVGGGIVIDSAKAMCMLCTNEGSVRDYLYEEAAQLKTALFALKRLRFSARVRLKEIDF